jgi:hypothetical protein
VGIGETNPTKNIDVRDATNASMVLKVTGASQFSFINDGTTADIGVTNQKDLTFSTGSNGDAERVRIDAGGHVGVKTSPSPWRTSDGVVELGQGSSLAGLHTDTHISTNSYFSQTQGWKNIDTGVASNYYQNAGSHVWRSAPSASAGASTPWVEQMRIDPEGDTTFTGNVSAPNITSRGQIIQDGAPVVDSLQIIRAFMKLRDAVDDPDSSVEQLREKLKVAVVDIIDQFQEQIDNMDDIDTPVVMPAEDSE